MLTAACGCSVTHRSTPRIGTAAASSWPGTVRWTAIERAISSPSRARFCRIELQGELGVFLAHLAVALDGHHVALAREGDLVLVLDLHAVVFERLDGPRALDSVQILAGRVGFDRVCER